MRLKESNSMITKAAFLEWVKGARPGERRHYHIGLLLADREYVLKLDALADAVWAAYKDGLVTLMQRRVEPGVCEYIVEAL